MDGSHFFCVFCIRWHFLLEQSGGGGGGGLVCGVPGAWVAARLHSGPEVPCLPAA